MSTAGAIHEVSLEFLRDGEPENRLLSQTTSYWALCGNFEPASLRLPFDQFDFELRVDDLSYTNPERGPLAIDDMARKMRSFLSGVPGLGAEVARAGYRPGDLVHLRLVLTPRELSQLPFEASQTPTSLPGGSTALVLQPAFPMTITREVRGITRRVGAWPHMPRILFAWAAPVEAGSVPWEAHARALRRAIDPWVRFRLGQENRHGRPAGVKERVAIVRELLTILPEADVESVADACAGQRFTHVHILAHGVPRRLVRDIKEVAIALHAPGGGIDPVTARRLAVAVAARPLEAGGGPAVVSLATCDSAQVRSAAAVGGSLAHELHMQGVPFVVASLFPLTKSGSTVLLDEMYRRLLDGVDPRVALYEARLRLYLQSAQHHDWASVVAYAALPPDIDKQVQGYKLAVVKRDIENFFDELDYMIEPAAFSQSASHEERDAWRVGVTRVFAALDTRVAELPERMADQAEAFGLQASAAKRQAEVLHRIATRLGWPAEPVLSDKIATEATGFAEASLEKLVQSVALYDKALKADLRHWVGVQLLSLQLVTACAGRAVAPPVPDMWGAMRVVAQRSLDLATQKGDTSEMIWSYGSFAELHLIAALWIMQRDRIGMTDLAPPYRPGYSFSWGDLQAHRLQMDHALGQVKALAAPQSFERFSTLRQFKRYATWWNVYFDPDAANFAADAVARLR
jgi:hypothetical protein